MSRITLILLLCSISPGPRAQTTSTTPTTASANWQLWEVEHQKWRMDRLSKAGPAKSFQVFDAWTKLQEFRTAQMSGGAARALGTKIDWGSGFPVTLPGSLLHKVYSAQDVLIDVFGKDSLENAELLNDVGNAFLSRGDYGDLETADVKLTEAYEIVRKVLAGVDHQTAARVHNNLGLVRMNEGRHAEARKLFGEAIRMGINVKGEDDAETIRYRQNLAVSYIETGEWATARQILRDAEKGALASLNGPAKGTPLSERLATLALIYSNQSSIDRETGNYPQQRIYLQLALTRMNEQEQLLNTKPTMEHALAESELGESLMNDPTSGLVEIDQAEAHLYKALEMLADRGMSFNPKSAEVMENLALLRFERDDQKRDDRQKARELMEKSLRIRRSIGSDMIGLGPWVKLEIRRLTIYGDYARATEVARDYARTLAKYGGPDATRATLQYATLLDALGQFDEAEKQFQQALADVRESLERAFIMQSEREQLQTISIFRRFLDAYLTHASLASRLNEQTYQQVLAWKGTVFERQRAMRTLRAQPAVQNMLEDLRATATQLTALQAHRSAHPEPLKERDEKIATLGRKMDALQTQLSELAGKAAPEGSFDSAAIIKSLPAGVALGDFIRYADTRAPSSKSGKWPTHNRYIAFVIGNQKLSGVELDDAAVIEKAVEKWRANREFDPAIGKELRTLVWNKIEPALTGAKIVLISPDGPLSALPFAALPEDQAGNGPLLERYALASIAVPSRLPAILATKNVNTKVSPSALLIGGVDFDHASQRPVEVVVAPANTGIALRGESGGHWNALPGTAQELDTVVKIMQSAGASVQPLEGASATKSAFASSVQHKRFVHLATHGFFSGGEFLSSTTGARGGASDTVGVDPGLLCGVCLAGANRPVTLNPDGSIADGGGILTATEVAQLDLSNAQTVVLSACESGLGVTRGGEGVLGLQRAFQLAGAQSVVASLWKVDDARTRDLMTSFYRRLLEKNAQPITALRGAQMELAKLRGASHPSLWAAWVLSGDPGDLAAAIREMDQPIEPLAELPPPRTVAPSSHEWRWGAGAVAVFVILAVFVRRMKRTTGHPTS